MLLPLGRLGLLAALTMFVMTAPDGCFGQEDAADAATEHADGGDHAEGEHDEAEHGEGEHGAAEHGAAEHGDSHGATDPPGTPPLLSFDIGSAICNIAIFLGVFAILAKFVWPAILNGLQARENKIHSDLEAAELANTEAKAVLANYQSKLDASATEIQAMLAYARNDAEANKQRIIEEAKAEAERQRERAIADIETAKKVALSDLAGQTSDMAINVAKQVVARELKPEDHADLIRKALERLPSNN